MKIKILALMFTLLLALALSLTPLLAQGTGSSAFTTEGAALGVATGQAAAPETVLELQPTSNNETLFTGGLINIPDGGYAGGDAGRMQEDLGSAAIGFNANGASGWRLAEEFTIPSGETWEIEWFKIFVYQTGAPVEMTTISSANFRIWDGPPGDLGSSVVFGDTTTNRLLGISLVDGFRDGNIGCGGICPAGGPDRPIQAVYLDTFDGGDWISLPAGTYWVDWQVEGDAMYSGPWAPYQVANGAIVQGNALQSSDDGVSWFSIDDAGVPSGLPMELYYLANDTNLFLRYVPYEDVHQPLENMVWEDSGQEWYHVMVSEVRPGGNVSVHDQWYQGSEYCGFGLCEIEAPILTNGNYEWAIEAWNTVGGFTGRDFTTFNVDVPPVQQLTISYPVGTISNAPIGIEFGRDPGASWYNVYVANGGGMVSNQWFPATEICDFGGPCLAPLDPIGIGNYQVWIAGWGPAGFGPYNSQPHTFSVDNVAAPGSTTLVNPADMSNVGAGFYTLEWISAPNALWYHITLNGPGSNDVDVWVHAAAVCPNPNISSTCNYVVEFVSGSYTWTMESWGIVGFGPASSASFSAS